MDATARLLGVIVAASCLVAGGRAATDTGSAAGRDTTQGKTGQEGSRAGAEPSTTKARGAVRPSTAAPRSGAATRSTKSAPPRTRAASTARPRGRQAVVVAGLPYAEPENPAPTEPDDSGAVPVRAPSLPPPGDPSTIRPLPPAAPPSGTGPRGALRLEIGPPHAQVYVDGFYAGTIEEANRSPAGLSLGAGWHRVEVRAPGFVTPAINVTIEPDRTLIYRGELMPARLPIN